MHERSVTDLDDLEGLTSWRAAAVGRAPAHVRSRLRGTGWMIWYHPPRTRRSARAA